MQCKCGFRTENKKSFSNHLRNGCPKSYRPTGLFCAECGKEMPKRKPSEQGNFCNQECYTKYRTGLRRGAYGIGVVFISGYFYRYKPDHPNCTKKGYVAVHRLVAEKKIKRYLNSNEVAHHKNEIKTDNRPSNIQVMTKSEHGKHHQNFRKCKDK